MSDDPSHRLDELKLLWESDPSSKVYLQLASVYRQKGQLEKAIEVLETSLQHRPRDPRGRVALARCRMELQDFAAAVELLEEVIRQDAAHIEANKQLLECYLRLADTEKATERLSIYKLLNDRDPELNHLEYRLRSLGDGGKGGSVATTSSEPAVPEPAAPAPAAPEPAAPEPAAPEPAAPEPAAVAMAQTVVGEESAPDQELFELPPEPEPAVNDSWDGDLFDLAPTKSVPDPAADLGGLWELREAVDLDENEDGKAASVEGVESDQAVEDQAEEDVPAELAEVSHEPDIRDGSSAGTATLGLLYLQQGYPDEAENIFRRVLAHDVDHEAALAGLQQLETQRTVAAQPAESSEVVETELEAEIEPEATEPEVSAVPAQGLAAQTLLGRAALEGGLPQDATGRKIAVLKQYIQHVRTASGDHVH